MKIIERGTQFNRYSVLIELNDGNGMRLQFNDVVSDEYALSEAQLIVDRQDAEQAYNNIETLPFDLLENITLLKEFIEKIKATPTITLGQYNTWLSTKPWYESAIIKYFVFIMATKLAERKGLVLDSLAETQVLSALRKWIIETDLKTIGKTVGYGSPNG